MKTRLLNMLFAAAIAVSATCVPAQEFPSRPMKVLVAYAPGGTPDVVSRFLGPLMTASLGQPIVVENKAGAGGLPAVQELIKSPPDGYTMLIADVSQYAILPAMRPGLYDPVRELQPLAQITTNSIFIMVNNTIPVKNMQEFLALVRAKPGQLNYGSPGVGTLHHLFMEAVKAAYGLNILHVPFKGSGQTVISLLNGDIPMAIAGVTTTQQQIKEGKLHAIAASTKERDKVLAPDVPSASEFGAPDIDYAGDQGYFLPVGTPKAVAEKLGAALAKATLSPEFAARAGALGTIVQYRNAEQFAELVRASYPRYQRVIKLAGIKPE